MIVRELINLVGFKVNKGQLKLAEQHVTQLTHKMESVGKTMSLMFTLPFVAITGWLAKTMSDFEQMDVAFSTMVGDADKANKLVTEMLEFAKATPFEISDIGPTVKMLLAMGATAENVIDELKMLGDVAAGLGVPISRLALNFGQVRAQTKLTGREIRDFAVAGVPIVSELAKMLGVTEAAILDMTGEGKISFDMVKEAFRRMTSEGGKFYNLMIKQSKTLGGLWSNFKDAITLSARKFEGSLLPALKKIVLFLTKLVDVLAKRVSPTMFMIVFAIGGMLAIIGPLLIALTVMIKVGMMVAAVYAAMTVAATAHNVTVGVLLLKYLLLAALFIAIIALLALLVEDFILYTKDQDSMFGKILPKWVVLKEYIDNVVTALENAGAAVHRLTVNWTKFWEGVGGKIFDFAKFFTDVNKSMASFWGMDINREKLAVDAMTGQLVTVPREGGTTVKEININSNITTSVPVGTPSQQVTTLDKTARDAVKEQWDTELRGLLFASPEVE